MNQQVINRTVALLNKTCWENIDSQVFSVDEWLEIAKNIRHNEQINFSSKLIARIQCLLVDNNLISDDEFVERLTASK